MLKISQYAEIPIPSSPCRVAVTNEVYAIGNQMQVLSHLLGEIDRARKGVRINSGV